MRLEGHVEALFVNVHGVGVLHGELTHPKQSALGSRLIPELALELVPDLGEFLVGAQFASEMRKDFLVGHAQTHLGPTTVFELKHLTAHLGPAPAALPDFARMQGGQAEFLGTDPVHLLADNSLDLVQNTMAQGKQRIDPRHELTHETCAHQEFMALRLGIGRVVTQGGNEGLRPAQWVLLRYRAKQLNGLLARVAASRRPSPR